MNYLKIYLQLYNEKANLIIDLGWYPSYDISGNYVLMLVKDFKWDYPLEQISSKSKKKLLLTLKNGCATIFLQNILILPLYKNIIIDKN